VCTWENHLNTPMHCLFGRKSAAQLPNINVSLWLNFLGSMKLDGAKWVKEILSVVCKYCIASLGFLHLGGGREKCSWQFGPDSILVDWPGR